MADKSDPATALLGKIRALAADLLDLAAERYGNDVCTDWEFPDDWTFEERGALSFAFEQYNGSPQGYDPEQPIGDNWIAMIACSRVLGGDMSFIVPLLDRFTTSGKIAAARDRIERAERQMQADRDLIEALSDADPS